MPYDHRYFFDNDNPITSLSNDQRMLFARDRYLGHLKSHIHNATKAIRTTKNIVAPERLTSSQLNVRQIFGPGINS